MDEFDRASQLEEMTREAAIAAARGQRAQGESARFCDDCSEPVPEARRLAAPGCRYCIECQKRRETVKRRGHAV